jgi:hypothetical protein
MIALFNGQVIFPAVNVSMEYVCCARRSSIGVISVTSPERSRSKDGSMPSDWKRDLFEEFPVDLFNCNLGQPR